MKLIFTIFSMVSLMVLGYGQPIKKVFIEEGSGTWCTNCPRGDVYVRELTKKYPGQFVFVTVHLSDPMEIKEYADAVPFTGIPAGWFDRSSIYTLLPFTDLDSDMAAHLSKEAPAEVTVQTGWNADTREITIKVSAEMAGNLSGDFRLAAIVVEDGVTGTGPQYDQVNIYSGGALGPMGGYENLPNPVPASRMVYNHVARHLAGGINGAENSLPADLNAGQSYSYVYKYVLPEDYNEEYVKVAGLLIDANKGTVLNAGQSSYLNGSDNARPFFHSVPQESAFVGLDYQYVIITHDPDFDSLTITQTGDLPEGISFKDEGNGTAQLYGKPTVTGTFPITLKLSDGRHEIEQSFILEVSDAKEDWIQVGKPGFSTFEATSISLKINKEGTAYVLAADISGKNIVVYSKDKNTEPWKQLGGVIKGDVFHSSMTLSDQGFPVVFSDKKVVGWNGTEWKAIGTDLPGSACIYPAIVTAGDGTLYLVYFDIDKSTLTFKFDGSNWQPLGTVDKKYTVWNQFKTDFAGRPMLIYGTEGVNISYSKVAILDNDQWVVQGGGYIEPASQTYFYHDAVASSTGNIYAGLTIGAAEQGLNIYQLKDDKWELIKANVSGGASNYCNLNVGLGGKLIATFRDGKNDNKVSAMMYDGIEWQYLGRPGFTNASSYISMAIDPEGNPWVAYQDFGANKRLSVKKYINLVSSVKNPKNEEPAIWLFPNPTNGEFTLRYSAGSHYRIFDICGKTLIKGTLHQAGTNQTIKEQTIDAGNLGSGIYFITVEQGGLSKTLKFIKL